MKLKQKNNSMNYFKKTRTKSKGNKSKRNRSSWADLENRVGGPQASIWLPITNRKPYWYISREGTPKLMPPHNSLFYCFNQPHMQLKNDEATDTLTCPSMSQLFLFFIFTNT
jgi:hypothetical protein